jgi:anti-sigma B factor antagonist
VRGNEPRGGEVLNVHSEYGGPGRLVVRVRGAVDMATHAELGTALDAALAADALRELVVDLEDVTFLDSSGVRVLLEARIAAAAHDARLVVRNPQPIVERVLQITSVAELLGLPPTAAGGRLPRP